MAKLRKSTSSTAEVVTSLRLTADQHRRLKALAARERRSVSQQLRFVIDQLTAESSADPDQKVAA